MRSIRIHVWAHRNPSAERVPDDHIEGNNGNYLWLQGAFVLAESLSSTVTFGRHSPEKISSICDVLLIPMANDLHPKSTYLRSATELIKQVRVPVIVLSIGAQMPYTSESPIDFLKHHDTVFDEFVSAVNKNGGSIASRGRFTTEMLTLSGGGNIVETLGCPSVFLQAPPQRQDKKAKKIAWNDSSPNGVFANRARLMELLSDEAKEELIREGLYIASDRKESQILLGKDPQHFDFYDQLCDLAKQEIEKLQDGQARYFTRTGDWINWLSCESGFVLGPRIHGVMAGMLGGTPGVLLWHDSRTFELGEELGIPMLEINKASSLTLDSVEQLPKNFSQDLSISNSRQKYLSWAQEAIPE